jgi:hypothetical protein
VRVRDGVRDLPPLVLPVNGDRTFWAGVWIYAAAMVVFLLVKFCVIG